MVELPSLNHWFACVCIQYTGMDFYSVLHALNIRLQCPSAFKYKNYYKKVCNEQRLNNVNNIKRAIYV